MASSSGSMSRMGSSCGQVATRRPGRHPVCDDRFTKCRELLRVGRGDRRGHADAAVARQLDAGMAQVEPSDQAEQIDLDALDPADLNAGIAAEIEFETRA